jgi:hypothetical protein
MKKVGVTQTQIDKMFSKKLPLGFKNEEQFATFKTELNQVMSKSGLDDAEVGLKGTSTTFYSENPGKPVGHHWDADPVKKGDYDLNIDSEKMVQKFQGSSISPSEKYGIFRTRDVTETYPELRNFSQKWSKILGRDVNFVGCPGTPTRDSTEYLLRSPQ